MDAVDEDHEGPIKASAAFRRVAEPSLADQEQRAGGQKRREPGAITPGQRGDRDACGKRRQLQDRHGTELRFEKEKMQRLWIDDIAEAAGHIGQYSGEPGDAGDGCDRRGDAQQDDCRMKRPRQSARTSRQGIASHVKPKQRRSEQHEDRYEMDPTRDDEELE